MISNLIIDPEFKSLIPPLSNEEYKQLEANLKAEGCRDPLVTWNGTLIDGHNRLEICTVHGIGFEKISKPFANRSAVIEWIIRNQFGRRNLDGYQRTKLALRLEETIKERAKAHQSHGSTAPGKTLPQKSAEALPPIETREEIAKLAGVSRDTVDKVKQIEKSATPDIKAALAKGAISINKAHQTVKSARQEPEPEPEPLIVDGTADEEPPVRKARIKKWVPDDADRLWLLAKQDLNKILPTDKSRERVLKEIVAYAQKRLESKK